jgi:hypothetical protein
MPLRPTAALFPVLVLLAGQPALRAQEQPPAGDQQPATADPDDPDQPSEPAAIPGLERTDPTLKPPALLREGSFIVRRRGSMAKLPSGEWAFIFHRDASGAAERPMVLVPCQTLQRMQQTAGDDPAQSTFAISGEVFSYRGVNYLLPTAAALESARTQPPASQPALPTPAPAGSAEVQDLIRRLEAQRDRPRTLDPAAMQGRPAADSDSSARANIIAEGKTLVRRKGRLVRTASGDYAFVFDAGSGAEPSLDRPLPLAPCLMLQQMESLPGRLGDAAVIELSGRILVYNNRNYLIPTLYQVQPKNDLQPRP